MKAKMLMMLCALVVAGCGAVDLPGGGSGEILQKWHDFSSPDNDRSNPRAEPVLLFRKLTQPVKYGREAK